MVMMRAQRQELPLPADPGSELDAMIFMALIRTPDVRAWNLGYWQQEVWDVIQGRPDLLVALIGRKWRDMIEDRVNIQCPEAKGSSQRYRENESLFPLATAAVAARTRWRRDSFAAKEAQREKDPKWRQYEMAQEEARTRREEERNAAARQFYAGFNRVVEELKELAIDEYRKSILFKFQVNGSAIGDLTAQEVDAWATAQGENVEFARKLITGISLADNRPIKDIVPLAEADAIWSSVKRDDG